MFDFVSIGIAQSRHCVSVLEDGTRHPLRYFETSAEANRFATSETIRLGLGPMYRGVPTA